MDCDILVDIFATRRRSDGEGCRHSYWASGGYWASGRSTRNFETLFAERTLL